MTTMEMIFLISSVVAFMVLIWGWETSGRWAWLSSRAQRRLQKAETPIAQEDSLLHVPVGSLERRLLEAGLAWSTLQFRFASLVLGLSGTFLALQFFVPGLPALVSGLLFGFAPNGYLNEHAFSRGLRLYQH